MSIAILAKKARTQRGASTRTGWTLSMTKSGKCQPCDGGGPAKQKSMRRVMASMAKGGDARPGGTQSDQCCKTTYKEVVNSKGNQSIRVYIWTKKQLLLNCVHVCDLSGVVCPPHSCNNTGCKCNCNKSLGGATCCNVHKDMPPISNSEYLPQFINERACLQVTKAAPRNNICQN